MPNVLKKEKQIAIISGLAEGMSMRALSRVTDVHQDTICRLAVRVGQVCARLLDQRLRNLECHYLEFDEIWGFIGKKEKHRRETEIRSLATFGHSARLMQRPSWFPLIK
jgi:hypothetical protein